MEVSKGRRDKLLDFLLGESRASNDMGRTLNMEGMVAVGCTPAKEALFFPYYQVPADWGMLSEPGQIMSLSLGVQEW